MLHPIMQTNSKPHAERAEVFNRDEARVNWHDETLWWIRQKRDKAAQQIPEWEALRDTASTIKRNVLANLHTYLEQFEKAAITNGMQVHWATDAAEHNRIVHGLLKKSGITQLVKSKSMLTEDVV
jgi:L-lactate dehydrogenase complex protein LldF